MVSVAREREVWGALVANRPWRRGENGWMDDSLLQVSEGHYYLILYLIPCDTCMVASLPSEFQENITVIISFFT